MLRQTVQQALVAEVFADRDSRTAFFNRLDFWVQAGSLTMQLFVFGRLFRWFGFRALIVSVVVLLAGTIIPFMFWGDTLVTALKRFDG